MDGEKMTQLTKTTENVSSDDLSNMDFINDIQTAMAWVDTEPNAPKHFTKTGNERARATITRALKIAEAVVREPSDGMIFAANDIMPTEVVDVLEYYGTQSVWLAMRDQMLKEVE